VLPFVSRPVCLPVLARLWHPRQTGKLAHARTMVELIAARHPDRTVHAVGDAAYLGDHLRGPDRQITWTSRLKITSVLHQLVPPHTDRSGRPRTKGPRLGTPIDLAATATWRRTSVRRYGRIDAVWITEITCLWYGVFHTRTVRMILVRDDEPRTRDGDDRGYGLPLVTTDLTAPAEHPGSPAMPGAGRSKSLSATPVRCSASGSPATGPAGQWNAPSRSGCCV